MPVKDYKIGNTRIIINDAAVVSREEVPEILKRVGEIVADAEMRKQDVQGAKSSKSVI